MFPKIVLLLMAFFIWTAFVVLPYTLSAGIVWFFQRFKPKPKTGETI